MLKLTLVDASEGSGACEMIIGIDPNFWLLSTVNQKLGTPWLAPPGPEGSLPKRLALDGLECSMFVCRNLQREATLTLGTCDDTLVVLQGCRVHAFPYRSCSSPKKFYRWSDIKLDTPLVNASFKLEGTLDRQGLLGWEVICPWTKGDGQIDFAAPVNQTALPVRLLRVTWSRTDPTLPGADISVSLAFSGISGEHLDPVRMAEEAARKRAEEFGIPSRPQQLPESLPASHGGQLSLPPEQWALTLAQFKDFMQHVRSTETFRKLTSVRAHCTLYDINDLFVIPWTRNARASIAVLLNPAGLGSCLMVSHAWLEDVRELEDALQRFFDRRGLPDDTPIWLCLLANYQPRPAFYIEDAGPTIAEQLALDPFGRVIKSLSAPSPAGHGMIAVHTTKANLYDRLWCPYEMSVAVHHKLDVVMAASEAYEEQVRRHYDYFMSLSDGDESTAFEIWGEMNVNTASASCASEADKRRIVSEITQSGGFERLDKIINLLRRRMLRDFLRSQPPAQVSTPVVDTKVESGARGSRACAVL